MKKILAIFLLIYSSALFAEPVFLSKIPLECEKVEITLGRIDAPNGFNISVLKAHKLAMDSSNVIKPCASKLEQVIYIDEKYYYFTNSVLTLGKVNFTSKSVKVDGRTGKTINGFKNI